MNCEALNDSLDLLMDGQLTDEQRREMQAHAQQCPQCAEAIRRTMQLKALFEQMEPEVDVPLPAQAKWRGAVREAAKQNRRKKLYRWISSAAAAVVVLVGVGLALNARVAPKVGVEATRAVLESAPVSEEAESAKAAYEAESAEAAYETEALKAPAPGLSQAAEQSEAAGEIAVIEADGAIADSDDDLADFDEAADAGMCAAVAQKAAALEATIRVKDVDAACRQIEDLAREYEGKADVRRLEDGGANVYLTLEAVNAADLIEAIAPLNVGGDALELPLPADGQVLQIMLTVIGE